jgi:hypothetical protein
MMFFADRIVRGELSQKVKVDRKLPMTIVASTAAFRFYYVLLS